MADLTEDQRAQLLERDPNGYYIGFERTGDDDIDAILSAVAWAAKGWHSTEGWRGEPEDYNYGVFVGVSPEEIIQRAANDAAQARTDSEAR